MVFAESEYICCPAGQASGDFYPGAQLVVAINTDLASDFKVNSENGHAIQNQNVLIFSMLKNQVSGYDVQIGSPGSKRTWS